ncbi:hypothetical protein Pryu01_02911 [Paraliobacillus ryukyuensis]|uniref:DNA-binding XRE family transcriptional regulator n=1 Tax=Paraliobacillus ryukyuensis TaxID=200904 RepID=A0A366DZE4_9BACI|nr:helix-turn-helix domain-containing protein [Paraliobacillus ryukyuensis]RBO95417.1 DNA-binding XRE family transcriptional regulator [Paraliobacillus ryukyuensis]
MITTQLATNIRYYRNKQQWTQQELADKLNISRSVIAKWENGDVTPDLLSTVKLSKLFEQTIDHLVGQKSYHDEQLSEYQQLYDAKVNLSVNSDKELSSIIDYIYKHPLFREQIEQMRKLPVKRQRAVHRMLKSIISEAKRL